MERPSDERRRVVKVSALDARVLRASDARYERSPEKVGEPTAE